MDWKTLLLVLVAAWFVASFAQRVLRVLLDIRDRLVTLQNTATLQFYCIEQIYEMSGIYEKFKETRPAEGHSLKPPPPEDVTDNASVAAWGTLVNRMQHRLESVVRVKYRPREETPDNADFDWYAVRDHHEGWVSRLPMLRGWPPFPRVCWWGTDEKEPPDVPLRLRDAD
jgi:hypothetical protein